MALLTYEVVGHEVVGHEVDGHEVDGHEVDGHEVVGHEVEPHEIERHDVLRTRFVALHADEETTAFVRAERTRRHGRLRWMGRAVARSGLGAFSANALFDTYPLFMLSNDQWRTLVGERAGGRLLDVGAAAGHVTTRLAPLFDEVLATDVSRPMVRRLRQRGLCARRLDLTAEPAPDGPYDAVALLNVLDRCAAPRPMLRHAHDALRPGGTLLVSMPLPYAPCWYDGPVERAPSEPLAIGGDTWEEAARSLVGVLTDERFDTLSISRAPYISGGDRHSSLYVLDAAVIVASRRT